MLCNSEYDWIFSMGHILMKDAIAQSAYNDEALSCIDAIDTHLQSITNAILSPSTSSPDQLRDRLLSTSQPLLHHL
jgi:hypothetical protein